MEDKQLSIKLRVHQIHAALCVWYPSRKIKQRTDQAFTDSQLSLFFLPKSLNATLRWVPHNTVCIWFTPNGVSIEGLNTYLFFYSHLTKPLQISINTQLGIEVKGSPKNLLHYFLSSLLARLRTSITKTAYDVR